MLSLDILLLVMPLRSTTAGAVPWIYYYRVLLVQPLVFTSAGAAHFSTTAGAVLGLPSAGTIALSWREYGRFSRWKFVHLAALAWPSKFGFHVVSSCVWQPRFPY